MWCPQGSGTFSLHLHENLHVKQTAFLTSLCLYLCPAKPGRVSCDGHTAIMADGPGQASQEPECTSHLTKKGTLTPVCVETALDVQSCSLWLRGYDLPL